MKKTTKVILIALLVLILGVGAVCLWQWDNLMAVKTSLSHSKEDLEAMMTTTYQAIEEATKEMDGVTVRDMTDEERAALRTGDLSREELIQRMTERRAVLLADGEQVAAEVSSEENDTEQEDPDQKLLSEYLAEIYLMKDEYTAWLEAKYNEAIDAYNALPEAERTAEAKYSIGMRCMKEALAKEDECDAAMAQMEQKISAQLEKIGRDNTLVKEIQKAYEQEKELKKAYYLGLHN